MSAHSTFPMSGGHRNAGWDNAVQLSGADQPGPHTASASPVSRQAQMVASVSHSMDASRALEKHSSRSVRSVEKSDCSGSRTPLATLGDEAMSQPLRRALPPIPQSSLSRTSLSTVSKDGHGQVDEDEKNRVRRLFEGKPMLFSPKSQGVTGSSSGSLNEKGSVETQQGLAQVTALSGHRIAQDCQQTRPGQTGHSRISVNRDEDLGGEITPEALRSFAGETQQPDDLVYTTIQGFYKALLEICGPAELPQVEELDDSQLSQIDTLIKRYKEHGERVSKQGSFCERNEAWHHAGGLIKSTFKDMLSFLEGVLIKLTQAQLQEIRGGLVSQKGSLAHAFGRYAVSQRHTQRMEETRGTHLPNRSQSSSSRGPPKGVKEEELRKAGVSQREIDRLMGKRSEEKKEETAVAIQDKGSSLARKLERDRWKESFLRDCEACAYMSANTAAMEGRADAQAKFLNAVMISEGLTERERSRDPANYDDPALYIEPRDREW